MCIKSESQFIISIHNKCNNNCYCTIKKVFVLQENMSVQELDLTDSCIGTKGIEYIATMLKKNHALLKVVIYIYIEREPD